MRAQCLSAVMAYAANRGKTLTQGDLKDLEKRLLKHARYVGNDIRAGDQRLAAMSPAERMKEVADRAGKEILLVKQTKAVNVARQILATKRNELFTQRVGPKVGGQQKAVQRMLVGYAGSQNMGFKPLTVRAGEIKNFYLGKMVPFFKATEKMAGFFTDQKMVADFVRSVKGQKVTNAVATHAAKLWNEDVVEPLRKQSNDAGSNIPKRGDFGLPQAGLWDPLKVAAVGKDEFAKDMLPLLDRTQYNHDDGRPMTDAEMVPLLHEMYEPLATDGASESRPGTYQSSSIKNRGGQERQLHFKDGDAYLAAHAKYSSTGISQLLVNHLSSVAHNIAAMETFGPNSESGFKYMSEAARKADILADPKNKAKADNEFRRTQAYFDTAMGKSGPVANPAIAHAFENWRSLAAMAKLPFAPVRAIGDTVFLHLIANANNIPQAKAYFHEFMGAKDAKAMNYAGIGLETVQHELNRFAFDNMGGGMPSKMANMLFKANLLNGLDAWRRRGVGGMMMAHAGELTRTVQNFADLDPVAERVMVNSGVTDRDWQVWRKAELDNRGRLTPDAIMHVADADIQGNNKDKIRRNAAQSLVGYAGKQSEFVVPLMTPKTQAEVQLKLGKRVAGDVVSELVHSTMQFKSFIVSAFANNWAMLMDQPTPSGKFKYGAALVAGTMVMGALSNQIYAMLHGKNPETMDPTTPEGKRFWVRAMAQGGSMGLMGDIAMSPIGEDRYEDLAAKVLGPTYETLNDAVKLGVSAGSAIAGEHKPEDVGAQAVKFVKGMTPSTFYTQTIFDHLVFQNLLNYYKPGYGMRIEQRAQKEQNTSFYWPPGTGFDQIQAPNLNTAVGRQ